MTVTAGLLGAALVSIVMPTNPATAQPNSASSWEIVEPAPPPDDFYELPADLASYRPGAVIRSRPVQLAAPPARVTTWQLLYRSTGMSGAPAAAVTTLLVPLDPPGPHRLLSYQAAVDSTVRTCAPSYTLLHGESADSTEPAPIETPSVDRMFAAAGLAQGWTVAIPDHGGIDNRFLTPRQPGWAVLDGIRAAAAFAPAGLAGTDTPVALWGYSGGAIASSWAVEEQPGYAPELNIVGAAIGAPVRDLPAALRSVDGALLGGLIPVGLGAISKDSAEFARTVAGYLTPDGQARVAETRRHCVQQNLTSNPWSRLDQLLRVPVEQALADPVIARELAARGISGRSPTAPVYLYNGVNEEVAPIAATDRLADSYCRGGTPVAYRREELPPALPPQTFTTHGAVYAAATPAAFAWLKQRMTPGAAPMVGCDIQSLPSTSATPEGAAEFGSFLADALPGAVNPGR
ncbi:lipase family protein [Skermania piniformis]|uniref:Lipase family protein n=1 Tax=Skermania pinensis TaxID=39122 RepID=A0ABX8S4C7_9ACTN|nr:lipase family protein [Skermania piniformis]QXQ12659.1 lipase family protein [Skermania piniformis]